MKILVACEESQTVCKAFRERGHEAYSCDIQECSGGHPEWHIQGDVLNILNPEYEPYPDDGLGYYLRPYIHFRTMNGQWHLIDGKWDMIIAHPPCTYMSKAGARWMYETKGIINKERLQLALEAKDFFEKIYNAACDRIVIENPTPLKIINLPNPTQIIEPYEYGHPFSKRTCLWIKGLPKLKPTNIIKEHKPYCPSNTSNHSKGKGGSKGAAHTAKSRSRTFNGIARAMAEQWG